jgi:hypothetical protein
MSSNMTKQMLPYFVVLVMGAQAGEIQVDTSFPGGNVIVEKIEGDTITVRPDLRNTKGYWFYWCFRVCGASGRRVTFQFNDANPAVGVRGPAVSTDEGKTWSWLEKDFSPNRFSYTFSDEAGAVRFGMGMTYTEVNWKSFVENHPADQRLRTGQLCHSREGRAVEYASIQPESGAWSHRVVLTSRHHSCEMMASYVLEGVIDQVLANDEDGRWLAEHVEFLLVPFVDKDGVEDGDQGKNRMPKDHNRDYDGEGLYPETQAIRETILSWGKAPPVVTIDLHCPSISGDSNEVVYQVGSKDPKMWTEQQIFGRLLESACRGLLPYLQSNDVPFGKAWNTEHNFVDGLGFSQWAETLPGVRVAIGMEIPYANASGEAVTAESARQFGRDLARALKAYLDR